MIAEDAGEAIVAPFVEMAAQNGFGYLNNTVDVARLHADGIEFESGASLEAEIKIIIPPTGCRTGSWQSCRSPTNTVSC